MSRNIVPQCYSSCVSAITSRQNPIVARFRDAAKGGSAELVLLDGVHLVAEALGAGLRIRESAVINVRNVRPDVADLAERLRGRDVPVATVSASVMQALSPVRSPSPVVALAERPSDAGERVYRDTPLVIIAIDIQDPGNVGAIVRVAEAGGATGVVCAGACADPFGWKALRGAMGSTFRLPVAARQPLPESMQRARAAGLRLFATVPRGGTPLPECDLQGPCGILLGGEGPGLPAALLNANDSRMTIPMRPPVESLNVAIAAALILYEASTQRAPRPLVPR